jgi:hypothetical protein
MKTIFKTLKSLFLSVFVLSMMVSCSDDLNIKPEGQITPEGFFSTDRAVELVNAIYNNLLQWPQHSFSWLGVSSIISDDADKGSDPGDTGADKDKLDALTFTATDPSANEVWGANFRGITRSNTAINIISSPETQIDETFRNRLIGEARFMRAYFYFNLVRMFGDVPKLDRVLNPNIPEDLAAVSIRVPKSEIYDLIVSDLTFASENLFPKSEMDIGRATSGAAKTLLAKVNMYLGNWSEVKRLTDEVIASGEYNLQADYATLWRESSENGPESIFEVQGLGGPLNLGVQGYVVTQSVRGQWGWGFNTPSQDLVDAYDAAGDEIRKNATIIFAGETMWDGEQVIASPPNPRYNEKAYLSRVAETFNGNDWESNKNIRILRYAEVLLMNAEAANELGQTGPALQSLNEVRQRVNLPDVTTTNQAELRMAIWNERRLELAFEHDRWFDLIRQGRAGEVMRALGKPFVDGKHELFPIPQRQIEVSGGQLTQNPGY